MYVYCIYYEYPAGWYDVALCKMSGPFCFENNTTAPS